MKNSDRLNQIAQHDFLCRMNDNIKGIGDLKMFEVGACLLDIIEDRYVECRSDIDTTGYKDKCCACIARWLNAEYDGRW